MSESLLNFDYRLFQLINETLASNIGDSVLVMFREKLFWYPLYIFLIALTIQKFNKRAYLIIITAIVLVALSDQLSSHIIKPWIGRLRPCNTDSLQSFIRVLAPCSGSYSFPSSHAVNHFAVGTFFFLVLKRFSLWSYLLFIWAGSIAVSQVYVGLHFPIDITAGAILGIALALILYRVLFHFYLKSIEYEDIA